MCREVIVIGAGGHGRVIADIINKSGDTVYGFLDDAPIQGLLGKIEDCEKYRDKFFVIAIGNNKIRSKIAEKYPDLKYYTAIHPAAVISSDAEIGQGTVVMAKAVVNSMAKIGKHCIVNTSSIVEHDNVIGDYVHISPGAVLCGTVKIGRNSHIGANAVVKNNINIASDVVIGCGGAVVRDIEKSGIYAGVPVKELQ